MAKENRYSLSAFTKQFDTEEKCRDFLRDKRWPDGFVCPKCGRRECCQLSNGLMECAHCHHQTSVTAGTIMHKTHLPLTKWFQAIYLLTQDKRAVSAKQLEKELDAAYNTARKIRRRICEAMRQRDAMHMLGGVVEFDDIFFGDSTQGKRGRGTEKTKVLAAVSLDD